MTAAVGLLRKAAALAGTPCYVYDLDSIRERFARLRAVLGHCLGISYAIKANPNTGLLRALLPLVDSLDASSLAEVERAIASGCPASHISFSGPAKRRFEIEAAVALGIGELVLESVRDAEIADECASARRVRQPVLIRITPTWVPRHFGASMAGRASQFGIDEEDMAAAIDRVRSMPHLELIGFHIYSGSNSLSAEAIAANFGNFAKIFRRAVDLAGVTPRKLIFGSGFGIPYADTDAPLDVEKVAALVAPIIAELKADARFRHTTCVLEMGRWLVGPGGWLLTSVVAEKASRGIAFRACDAGFNNHLAACGMMGTVIRRNWAFSNVSNPDGARHRYTLVGPLCTTIDVLATDIDLPELRVDDIVAIANSGAYGLTASPTRFISHPEPAEVLIDGAALAEVTESRLNHPGRREAPQAQSGETRSRNPVARTA